MAKKVSLSRREKIKLKIRKSILGTSQRPRLSIFRSNKAIYAQIINDDLGTTIVAASSSSKDFTGKGTKIEQSKEVGKLVANKAIALGIQNVVFDRNGYLYHGRVKSLAEGAREAGLNF